MVLDNSSTHKTAAVRKWLEKHPRFKLHFTPTSASWLNAVDGEGGAEMPDEDPAGLLAALDVEADEEG